MFPDGGESEIVNESRVVGLMQSLTQAFRRSVPEVFAEYGQEKAQEFEDELRFKLSAQLFHLAPLQRAYYLGKLQQRLDPRTLIRTGEYLAGIMNEQVEDSEGVTFRVGMRPGIHQSSGLPMKVLQRILEHGTSRIPARPHWHPLIIQYQARSDEIARGLRSRLAQRVHQNM